MSSLLIINANGIPPVLLFQNVLLKMLLVLFSGMVHHGLQENLAKPFLLKL
jgi:hypothetical protein